MKIDDARWRRKLVEGSNGDVLVLGSNLIARPLALNGKVTNITVVEANLWAFVDEDEAERDTVLWMSHTPSLKEAMPIYFRIRNKYPKAVIGIYGCQEASDINVGKTCRGEGETRPYGYQVLRGTMRDYVISKIKKPMMKAITTLANRYPEPTRVNCLHPNSHILFDIQDKFFEYEDNHNEREAMFRAAFKILIAEYEHDPYYRYRFDWILEQIIDSDWKPRKIRNEQCWKEPV